MKNKLIPKETEINWVQNGVRLLTKLLSEHKSSLEQGAGIETVKDQEQPSAGMASAFLAIP